MMFLRIFLLVLFFLGEIYAAKLTYEEIRQKPKSIAKDYYIYRLLSEENISKNQAQTLLEEVSRLSPTLKKEFSKIIDITPPTNPKVLTCQKTALREIENMSEECIKLLVYPSFVTTLGNASKEKLKSRLNELNYTFTLGWIEALESENTFETLTQKGAKEFFLVFNAMPQNYKKDHLDKKFPKDFITKLEKEKSYENFVKNVIINSNYANLQKSLLYKSENSSLTYESYFFLGINAVKFDAPKIANDFFVQAEQKAYYKSDQDKAMFWRYLTAAETDTETLERLAQSHDINIYSLYAKEVLDMPISNITFLEANEKQSDFDIKDPFAWKALSDKTRNMSIAELENLSSKFDTKTTLPVFASLKDRISRYRHNYFIVPYEEYLNDLENERKTLILSLARKESRFIPATISTSYALGIMQFMPFLARDTAEKLKIKNFDIDDMFDPKIAYQFADFHLNYLNSYLYHPLFVAYAYNGGIGFTKRMLQSGNFFNNKKYEPFLSLETITYAESREYGKSVLANYVVYSRHFGNSVSIRELLINLTEPQKTDRFRQPTKE